MTNPIAHRIVAVSRNGGLFTVRVFRQPDCDTAASHLLNNYFGAGAQIRTVEAIDAASPYNHGEVDLGI